MSTVEISNSTTPSRSTPPFQTPQTMSLVVQLGNAVCSSNLITTNQQSPLAATAIATNTLKSIGQFPPSPDVAASSSEVNTIATISSAAIISHQTPLVVTSQLQALYKKPIVANTVSTKVNTSPNNGIARMQTVNVQRSVQLSHISPHNKMQVLTNLVVPKQNFVVNKVASGQLRAPNQQTTLQLGIGPKQLIATTTPVVRPIVGSALNVINANKVVAKPPQILNNINLQKTNQSYITQQIPQQITVNNNVSNRNKFPQQTHVISRVITPVTTTKTPQTLKINAPQTTMVVQQRASQMPGIKTLPPQTSPTQKAQQRIPNNVIRTGIKTIPPQRTNFKNQQNVKSNKFILKNSPRVQQQQQPPQNHLLSPKNKQNHHHPIVVQPNTSSVNRINTITTASSNILKYHGQQFQVVPVHNPNPSTQHITQPPGSNLPSMTVLRTVASYEDNNVPTNIANTLFSPTSSHLENVDASQDNYLSEEDMISEVRPDYSKCLNPVLFDHNYHLPPPDSPPPSPVKSTQIATSSAISADINPVLLESHRNGILTNSNTSPPTNYLYNNNKLVNSKLNLPYQADNNLHQAQDDDAGSTISSDAGREVEPEGEETETAPEGEGDEDSVTRCICDFEHDDGYMICCDKCFVWQHVDCMFIDRQNIQEEYLCERCEPRRVYRQRARAIQLRKREEILNNGSSSDTSSASSNNSLLNNNISKKQRPGNALPQVPIPSNIPTNIANRRKNEPGGAAQRNRSLTLQQRRARRDLSSSTAAARKNTVVKRRQERKVQTKRKTKIRRNQEIQDDSQDAWDRKDSTLTQLRQWIENYEEAVTNHYSPELRQRLVKQNVQNSSSNLNNFHSLVQANANVHKCRTIPQTNLGTKILVSSIYLQANIPIIELRGKYMLAAPQTSVATTPPGLISRTQSQKPGPFVFFYKLPKYSIEVCVDTRTYGNDARFVRRSCKPNAEIRHCIEKGTLHLYLVSVVPIDKNTELTIKHDGNVLPNSICACGNPLQCGLASPVAPSLSLPLPSPSKISLPTTPATPNNSTLNSSATTPSSLTMVTRRSNGMAHDLVELNPQRKRRGRRTTSTSESDILSPKEVTPKPTTPIPPAVVIPPPPIVSPVPVPEVIQPPAPIVPPPPVVTPPQPIVQGPIRRSSQNTRVIPPTIKPEEKSETVVQKPEEKDSSPRESKEAKDIKKMTREERKMEAIMKAFERLEKQEQRKQESKTRQSHRRDSDVPYDSHESKSKRKKRKGRTRTVSTNSASGTRRTRLNSTDSYMTSGDESSLLSPPLPMSHDHESHPASEMDTSQPDEPEVPKTIPEEQIKVEKLENTEGHAAGLLLALANGGQHTEDQLKSPVRDNDTSSSAGSVQSSPGTPVSSNCLLVAAAVEQITPGFKFPKTKKAIMNEWLNKSPEPIQTPSLVPGIALNPHIARPLELPSMLPTPAETSNRPSLNSLAQAATICSSTVNVHPTGNAKKRWLRQAISEECDSPNSRPESPHTNDVSAPPKKRRLARESVSSEQSFTPPTTPTRPNQNPTGEEFEDEFYSEEKALIDCLEDSNHKNSVEDEAQHHLNLIKENQENGMLLRDLEQHDDKNDSLLSNNFETAPVNLTQPNDIALRVRTTVPPVSLDPRLRYESPHCLDKVEEALQLLESWTYTPKHENVPPAKRKLSISEYRQRKQQVPNHSDKLEKNQNSNDSTALNPAVNNHTNDGSSESPRPVFRTRTNSSSSATSSLSSDDEQKDPTATLLSSIDTILEKSASKPKLAAFNSAPTLVERQRENLTARLKREFGLSVPEDEEKKNSVESLGDTTILGQRISFRTNSFLTAVDSPLLDDKTSSSDTSLLQNQVNTPNKVDIVPSIPTTTPSSNLNNLNSTNSLNYPSSATITPTVPIQNGIKSTGSNINFITPFDNPAYSTNTTYYTGFASSKPPPPPFLSDGKTQPVTTPPPTSSNVIIPRK